MSESKHHAVRFTVPFSCQKTFFECLPVILPDLKYFITQTKDLECVLDVIMVFSSLLDADLCHKDFDMFYDICKNHDVHFTSIDS